MNQAVKLRDEKYYQVAHKGSLDISHPAMKRLLEDLRDSRSIVDLGCGEGTRLNLVVQKLKKIRQAYGVDNNDLAIKRAKKQYPNLRFIKANLEKIPLKKESFDSAFSAFVFEHLFNTEKVFSEAYRLLKIHGKLVVIAPNFGSPNRRSPNSNENKIAKLFKGMLKDIRRNDKNSLGWIKVEPKKNTYTTDADTTLEPYLGSLINYAKYNRFKVIYYSSCWQQDRFSFYQLPFKILAFLGIYPFTLWGPHLLAVLQKKHG